MPRAVAMTATDAGSTVKDSLIVDRLSVFSGEAMPVNVRVTVAKRHKYGGILRMPGDRYLMAHEFVSRALRTGLIFDPAFDAIDWAGSPGRDLRPFDDEPHPWLHIVACVNIWNDTPALRATLPSWYEHVDAVVVADGPYATVPTDDSASTDGLEAYLDGLDGAPVTRLTPKQWGSQPEKRTALLREASRLYPRSLLFVVDADESVSGAEHLRDMPMMDLGWVVMESPLYKRLYQQPRLIRASEGLTYTGRHHWLYDGDRLLASHQYGGSGVLHRGIQSVKIRNNRGLGHSEERKSQKKQHLSAQRQAERQVVHVRSDAMRSREPLRIVNLTRYDAGMAVSRFHTAINSTTPHTSIMGSSGIQNPFRGPMQFDIDDAEHAASVSAAIRTADIVHLHVDERPLRTVGADLRGKTLVMHHHGTAYRSNASVRNAFDAKHAALRLVSNLELLSYGENLHWLPNPIPVAYYRAMLGGPHGLHEKLYVGHSPSKRARKGTEKFIEVCNQLIADGVPIEMVLIEKMSFTESLMRKSHCDIFFDSFDLGIQCSGLEAAALGIPVLAGDRVVRDRYIEMMGECPYSYVGDEEHLYSSIRGMVESETERTKEAERVKRYVEQYHDDAAVALRYLDLLDDAIGWRSYDRAIITHEPPPSKPHLPKQPAVPKPAIPTPHTPPQPETR